MRLSSGHLARLCLTNMAIGGLTALPINLFNRLMAVELGLLATLPGLLVALHYGVQLTRPVWGHRSDAKGGRTPFILGGIALIGLGLIGTAWAIAVVQSGPLALAVWVLAYIAIGLGVGAAGTSFLALLATASPEGQKGAWATAAWLALIFGAIVASVGTGIALDPYAPDKLIPVVSAVSLIGLILAFVATWGIERNLTATAETTNTESLREALRTTMADPAARGFTGFVFLSILAFFLSEMVLEPFAGHVHGLPPEDSTKLSGGKDGAALLGMLLAGGLSTLGFGSLRSWAVAGCAISAVGLIGLALQGPLVAFTVIMGLGNGLFVVGAVGSMMRLAAAEKRSTGTRMGVFGAAQAVAAGLASLISTATVDVGRVALPIEAAYASVFFMEAGLFVAAAFLAMRLLSAQAPQPQLQPGE